MRPPSRGCSKPRGEADFLPRKARIGTRIVKRGASRIIAATEEPVMGAYSPNIIANSVTCCATHNGDGEVIVYGDRRITRKEFASRIFAVASALVELGVKRGDKVAFMFHNTPEFLEINFGIQVAGGVPAPINYRFTPREVEFQVDHCDARVLLYDSIWKESVEAAAPALKNIEHFVCRGGSGLAGARDYDETIASAAHTDPRVKTDWEDVAVMIYTGGTTGPPKGVMLTYQAHLDMFSTLLTQLLVRSLTIDLPPERHQQLLDALPLPKNPLLGPILRTRLARRLLGRPETAALLRRQTRKMLSDPDLAKAGYRSANKYMYPSMPFFHDASYANIMMAVLTGSSIIVLPDSVQFDPGLVLSLVEKERVFNMANVPTGWKKLVSHPGAEGYDLSSLRLATTGGGLCPVPLKKRILELFPNAMILDAFGQTEMTPVTSFRIDADPSEIEDRSVGKSIVEVRVVGENGKELPRGEVGEILYRSSTVMKGYYKDQEKTEEVMKDGWFRSGDMGYLDESGEIRVVDRKKECINTGGEKVFPMEVEEIIGRHPKVDDVCVIGVPDEEWGSSVRAVVQLKPGKAAEGQEIREFCRGELAGYKIPRTVVVVEELPRSPVGKMLREKVRELYGKA
jgi:acyl-CoA synthetase (AMP-forming)/AMP-acid ligase II